MRWIRGNYRASVNGDFNEAIILSCPFEFVPRGFHTSQAVQLQEKVHMKFEDLKLDSFKIMPI